MWDNCIAAEWLDGLKHSHVWTGAIFFSSNSLFKCEQLVNLQSAAFPDCNLEKRDWREGSGRGKQWHTPLHLFVVLSRMALVETILPYLEEEQKGEPLFFMYHTEPVIKHTHAHTHEGREGWATIYDITGKIWETGSGFHGVLKIPTSRELDSPLFFSCFNCP